MQSTSPRSHRRIFPLIVLCLVVAGALVGKAKADGPLPISIAAQASTAKTGEDVYQRYLSQSSAAQAPSAVNGEDVYQRYPSTQSSSPTGDVVSRYVANQSGAPTGDVLSRYVSNQSAESTVATVSSDGSFQLGGFGIGLAIALAAVMIVAMVFRNTHKPVLAA